jgi:hypothetical protein
VVGSIKAGISLITGTDPITGEAVSRWSSALNVGIAMIPGAAVAAGVAKLTSEHANGPNLDDKNVPRSRNTHARVLT